MHERRGSVRLQFPTDARPRIVLADGVGHIIDCAREGLKYRIPAESMPPEPDATVTGTALFPGDIVIPLKGRVIWVYDGTVALQLDPPGISDEALEASVSQIVRAL